MAGAIDERYLENEILSVLMRHKDVAVKTALVPEDFGEPKAGMIFKAIRACIAEGMEPDIFAVSERIGENSVAAVAEIAKDYVGSKANFPHMEAILKRLSKARHMRHMLIAAQGSIESGKHDPDKLSARLMLRLAELDAPVQEWDRSSSAVMSAVVDRIEEIHQCIRQGKPRGLETGIPGLDRALGGLHPGDLTIMAGRPAMGKTSAMLSIAHHMAGKGAPIGIISAEMSGDELGIRQVSLETGIPSDRIRRGELSESDFTAISRASGRVSSLPIRIFDRPNISAGDIAIQARAWKLTGGLSALFVDYLQRLDHGKSGHGRNYDVGETARALKNLARSLHIPVVVLAQVNRECEKRPNKRPTLSDLRDSGEIEAEADQVLFLFRPFVYDRNADPEAAEIIIDKNRHGPNGVADARFDSQTMRWTGEADSSRYAASF